MGLQLCETTYDDPVAVMLIAEVQQEYVARYGGPDETPLVRDEFAPPDGVFLLARIDNFGHYRYSSMSRCFARDL